MRVDPLGLTALCNNLVIDDIRPFRNPFSNTRKSGRRIHYEYCMRKFSCHFLGSGQLNKSPTKSIVYRLDLTVNLQSASLRFHCESDALGNVIVGLQDYGGKVTTLLARNGNEITRQESIAHGMVAHQSHKIARFSCVPTLKRMQQYV